MHLILIYFWSTSQMPSGKMCMSLAVNNLPNPDIFILVFLVFVGFSGICSVTVILCIFVFYICL